MKLQNIISTLALTAAVQGSPVKEYHEKHKHQEHKRDVLTVWVTEVVAGGSTNAPTTTDTQAAAGGSAGESVEVHTSIVSEGGSASAGQSGSATGSSQSASASGSSSADSSASYSGKGVAYSSYRDDGTCKDASTVKSDFQKLSGFELIRIYDTDCDIVNSVLGALTGSQKLFAGIYYLDKIQDSVDLLASAVKSNGGSWDKFYTISVGNELVNDGKSTVDQIGQAVNQARSALKSAGYSGKIVSVDTLTAVKNNPGLCQYSDYVAVNCHPFWDGSVTPDNAGTWLQQQISDIKTTCGGSKDVLITESGWPHQGQAYGKAVPSPANQKTAVDAISKSCGEQVILFDAYDDLWKNGGPYGVEKYWGLY
ncbi:hypothetical protein WICPIJ_006471 [Wickerhamomyces pijperi]|uniref:Glycoside hydrolase family 17 protein n=1 Tax=Wickerhamomyces pijperi TaxID=599730 RepID=A0A9P8Q4C8_WICPI|nr:hypothetical protein WICPIJ_006471 [Wickerhamomyces pijperi]